MEILRIQYATIWTNGGKSEFGFCEEESVVRFAREKSHEGIHMANCNEVDTCQVSCSVDVSLEITVIVNHIIIDHISFCPSIISFHRSST
jgi:hypothetical protein